MGARTPDRPLAEQMTLGSYGVVDESVLWVDFVPRDTAYRLHRGRVPVELRVTSGDREVPGLYRWACPPRERGTHFNCFKFTVMLAPGQPVISLDPFARRMGGRIEATSATTRIGDVVLFEPGRTAAAANVARNWPGVLMSEVSSWVIHPSWLTVPVLVRYASPAQGDGVLQVMPGDTIVATYEQPDGSVITWRRAVP